MGRALGGFEQTILLAILQLGDDTDGVSIRRRIEARTGLETSTGALYTTLKRLERRGLVSSHVGEPTAERGGRRKRHYDLEGPGVVALRNSYVDYTKMAEGLGPKIDEAVARLDRGAGG